MIKKNLKDNNIKISQKESSSKSKEQLSPIEDENKVLNYNNLNTNMNEEFSKSKSKKSSNPLQNSDNNTIKINPVLNKVKTFSNERRTDRFGNMIIHGGKQKVSFIDRISKNNFTEVVKIENYKEYNKMEETSNSKGNNCCFLI